MVFHRKLGLVVSVNFLRMPLAHAWAPILVSYQLCMSSGWAVGLGSPCSVPRLDRFLSSLMMSEGKAVADISDVRP